MPVDLSNSSIMNALPTTPNLYHGPLGESWSLHYSGPVEKVSKGHPTFDISRVLAEGVPYAKTTLHVDFNWLRIEQRLDAALLKPGRYRLGLTYRYTSNEKNVGPRIKVIEYGKGGGQTFVNISTNLARSGSFRTIDTVFDLTAPAYKDREYRLCFELRKASEFSFANLSLIRFDDENDNNDDNNDHNDDDQRHVSPFRVYNFQVSKELCDLNDKMDSQLRNSPQDWIHGMLSVALRLEDYDTAAGLVRYARKFHVADRTLMTKAAPKILDTLIALGDLDQVKAFSRELSCLNLQIDTAIQLGRNIDWSETPRQRSYRLPSGKADLYSLNKTIEQNCGISFEDMLVTPLPEHESHLIWANYLRHFDDAEYVREVNSYLGIKKSPFSVRMGSYHTNILERIAFEPCTSYAGMTDGPLVSVITAAYNAEATIEYAIRSILNQNYHNIEILIADDCSTDGTRERLKAFAGNPRVRIFAGDENQGPYNIRNKLISEARGEIITFHDSDDVALPHRISTQLSAMIDNRARVSLGGWLRIKENGHFVVFRDGRFLRNCLNSIMFVRSVFDEFGPYRSVLCGADSEFYEMLRGKLASEITVVQEPLVLGLWSSSSLTRTAGIEADEVGYRAPPRRAYAAIASRQRILGSLIVPHETVEEVASCTGIYRAPKALSPFESE